MIARMWRMAAAWMLAAAIPSYAAEPATRPTAVPASPIRTLMFVGGVYHDYEKLPRLLAENLAKDGDIQAEITNNLGRLSPDGLKDVDVVFFNTCLDSTLTGEQRAAIIDSLRAGKGLVAMHCTLWSFQNWPEFRTIIGGFVPGHDPYGPYDATVVDTHHPIAADVSGTFGVIDEPYLHKELGDDVHMIVQTAKPHGGRSAPEPQAWTTRYAGGRVFTMTFGHDEKSQTNPAVLKLLGNGVRWAAGRLGMPAVCSDLERKEGFVPLFDGKSLHGWKYDPVLWKVKDGVVIGDTHPKHLTVNSCAIYEKPFADFILRFSLKVVSGNSGMQFRSKALPNFEVAGYQADAVKLGWGNLHEQNGRGRLVDGWTGKSERFVNLADWNDMEVLAQGPHIVIKVNGLTTADYTETSPAGARDGILAMQLHRDDPMEVRFTNIRLKPLPPPARPAR